MIDEDRLKEDIRGDFPKVYISVLAKQKFDAYIQLVDDEISGLGMIEKLSPNEFLIEDIFLFKQESCRSSTELNQDDVSDFLETCIKNDIDTEKIKCWWHSHGTLSVFWSSTDEECIESFNGTDWLISLVGNRDGDYVCRFDTYSPLRLTFDNIVLEVHTPIDNELYEELKKEVEEKVSAPSVSFAQTFYNPRSHFGYGYPKNKFSPLMEDDLELFEPEVMNASNSATKVIRYKKVEKNVG